MKSNLSFQELAMLQKERLSKQRPSTLEEKREQAMSVRIQSSRGFDEQDIKNTIRIYYPDWIEEKIEAEYQRLVKAYSK